MWNTKFQVLIWSTYSRLMLEAHFWRKWVFIPHWNIHMYIHYKWCIFYLLKHIRKHLHYKFLMCLEHIFYTHSVLCLPVFYGLFFDSINLIALEKHLSDLFGHSNVKFSIINCKMFIENCVFFFMYIYTNIVCWNL